MSFVKLTLSTGVVNWWWATKYIIFKSVLCQQHVCVRSPLKQYRVTLKVTHSFLLKSGSLMLKTKNKPSRLVQCYHND